MIQFYRQGSRLTFAGHARYAEKGKDIVCASVSTVLALYECALDAFGLTWEERENPRRTGVSVCVTADTPRDAQVCTLLADAVETVLRALAQRYPACVKRVFSPVSADEPEDF